VYLGQVAGHLEGAFEFFATQVLPRVPEFATATFQPVMRAPADLADVKSVTIRPWCT
jgi:hypothetical protein